MRGRPKAELMLTEPEREELVALTLRRKTAQALALRARIVLACADGQDSKVVAARQRVTPQTVGKWRARYVERRLDGLLDAPRSGAPRTIDDARVDAVIAKTLESVPNGATRRPRLGAQTTFAQRRRSPQDDQVDKHQPASKPSLRRFQYPATQITPSQAFPR
jgi:transposase